MLGMALTMLTIYTLNPSVPYLILGFSFVIGASASILVREAIAPTPQTRITKITALQDFARMKAHGFQSWDEMREGTFKCLQYS